MDERLYENIALTGMTLGAGPYLIRLGLVAKPGIMALEGTRGAAFVAGLFLNFWPMS